MILTPDINQIARNWLVQWEAAARAWKRHIRR
jgi:hypothetical protein